MREPLNLKLPAKVCYYNPGTDSVCDLRTEAVIETRAGPNAPDGYVYFSVWFNAKVVELTEAFREDGVTHQDPAMLLALNVAQQLIGEKHAS